MSIKLRGRVKLRRLMNLPKRYHAHVVLLHREVFMYIFACMQENKDKQ